jgi:hypothetical protein
MLHFLLWEVLKWLEFVIFVELGQNYQENELEVVSLLMSSAIWALRGDAVRAGKPSFVSIASHLPVVTIPTCLTN